MSEIYVQKRSRCQPKRSKICDPLTERTETLRKTSEGKNQYRPLHGIQSWYYPTVLWKKNWFQTQVATTVSFLEAARDHSETRSTGLEWCSKSKWYSSRAAFIQYIHDRPNISQHVFIINIILYVFSRNTQKPDTFFFFWLFPFGCFCVGVGGVETWTRFENLWGWLCMLSVQHPCMRCMYARFFSDTARAHSEMSRSRIIFLAHMIQQQSACMQCIHDRPKISQHLFLYI